MILGPDIWTRAWPVLRLICIRWISRSYRKSKVIYDDVIYDLYMHFDFSEIILNSTKNPMVNLNSFKLTWAVSSSELFLIAFRPSSVCLSVCLSVCPSVNGSIFDFYSRTSEPISTKLGTKHPLVKGIQVCSNEGPRLLNFLLQNHWANFNQTLHKASLGEGD